MAYAPYIIASVRPDKSALVLLNKALSGRIHYLILNLNLL
jgi:hypothetical protein